MLGKGHFSVSHTHTRHGRTRTVRYLSKMPRETKQKVPLLYIPLQPPFLFPLLILFSSPASLSPCRLFLHLLLPPLFPSLPPSFSLPSLSLITLVLYFRVVLLLKLVCATSRTLHTSHTRTFSKHSCAQWHICFDKDIHTSDISLKRALTHTHTLRRCEHGI